MTAMRHLLLATALAAAPIAPSMPAIAAGGGAEATKKLGGSTSFLPFQAVAVTVMRNYRPAGIMQVDFGLDIPDNALRERAAAMAPVVRDAMHSATSRYLAANYTAGDVPDANRLSAMLQSVADRQFGAGKTKVYLVSVLVR
jgi:hypothetical protein